MMSAVLALFAGWLHGYQVLDYDDVTKLLTQRWDESEVTARSRLAQFNADTLSALRSERDERDQAHGRPRAAVGRAAAPSRRGAWRRAEVVLTLSQRGRLDLGPVAQSSGGESAVSHQMS